MPHHPQERYYKKSRNVKIGMAIEKGGNKMYGETLPYWFWALYYLFLLTTLLIAISCARKRKMKGLAVTAIVFTLIIPIVSLINSIGRVEGMNEFEHLVSQFHQGASWSVFVMIGYLFILVWWILLIFRNQLVKRSG